ncbi:MAG: ATP-dependent DNA helicase [Candidatus Eremiobacteraeota bacterium]|nr:ATP-dependent DNA helicase [Candidatus Eremiobacteraeota bacterium]MBC5804143.1 ATP-dependent DNA helicase [Candidatus Eremiobacteraeota bacterium]
MSAAPFLSLESVFSADGPLARALSGFEGRPGQVAMSQLIERGFLESAHTVVEAGTGVGKSLAYLVPALRSGKKVVVSTATIALQEQLVKKDIPLVVGALGIPARVELLKGRNHYLCRAKLDRLRTERLVAQSGTMEAMWDWADRTGSGDRGELPFAPPPLEWEALDADADDCVGEFCERFRDCWFFTRRDAAKYADLVVVNHALFFLDVALGGTLLPAYDYVILDEAHQCERWASAALTATLSSAGVNRLMRRLHRHYALPAEYDAEIDHGMRGLAATLARVPGERYPLAANDGAPDALGALQQSFYRLENWLYANWQASLKHPPDNVAEAERRRENALRGLLAHIATIDRTALPKDEAITWVERGERDGRYEINSAPFDVADYLRTTLFARAQSVVLTSATIATGGSFAFLRRSLGVDEAQEYVAPSPFDYRAQARLFIAPGDCNPKEPHFARRVAPLVEEILDVTSGRAFVLFTSYARLHEVYALVRERIPFPVKLQGELPRAHLLDWFRRTNNAVLFATSTFWEGIDVVGDRLSCVIIDRLPFPSPADPLVAARVAAIESAGGHSFEDYMIPSAIVRLKQGFGRLIRTKSDRGLVVLLDGRAVAMRYGASIIAALPPAKRVTDLADVRAFFDVRPVPGAQAIDEERIPDGDARPD